MSVSPSTLVTAASDAIALIASLVKEMPELIEVVENAVTTAKSGTVVTAADIATQLKAVDALNAKIQADAAAVVAGTVNS